MEKRSEQKIIQNFRSFIGDVGFPCVAAKDAISKDSIKIMTAQNIACPADDKEILNFIYDFTDEFRNTKKGFYSAAILFNGPFVLNEKMFDMLMWQRLQALHELDAKQYTYDARVNGDPSSSEFSFSLKEEAFFIIALHPGSSRAARRFQYPALIFNPHTQFERMKQTEGYEKMKNIVRKRDVEYSGSVNPMLTDFGEASEAFQYSGMKYDKDWKCPLKINNK